MSNMSSNITEQSSFAQNNLSNNNQSALIPASNATASSPAEIQGNITEVEPVDNSPVQIAAESQGSEQSGSTSIASLVSLPSISQGLTNLTKGITSREPETAIQFKMPASSIPRGPDDFGEGAAAQREPEALILFKTAASSVPGSQEVSSSQATGGESISPAETVAAATSQAKTSPDTKSNPLESRAESMRKRAAELRARAA
jgi:hypothetical protein